MREVARQKLPMFFCHEGTETRRKAFSLCLRASVAKEAVCFT